MPSVNDYDNESIILIAVVVKNVYSRQTIVDFSTVRISVYNCVTELHSHIYFSSKVTQKLFRKI